MTREEAKELLPIIQAWAEGKNIQYLSNGEWNDINQSDFTCYPDKYRIKPELEYRPFKTQEERMKEIEDIKRARELCSFLNITHWEYLSLESLTTIVDCVKKEIGNSVTKQ